MCQGLVCCGANALVSETAWQLPVQKPCSAVQYHAEIWITVDMGADMAGLPMDMLPLWLLQRLQQTDQGNQPSVKKVCRLVCSAAAENYFFLFLYCFWSSCFQ